MNLITQSPCSTFPSGTYSPGSQIFPTIRHTLILQFNEGPWQNSIVLKGSVTVYTWTWKSNCSFEHEATMEDTPDLILTRDLELNAL